MVLFLCVTFTDSSLDPESSTILHFNIGIPAYWALVIASMTLVLSFDIISLYCDC